jgi:hypothetical protein
MVDAKKDRADPDPFKLIPPDNSVAVFIPLAPLHQVRTGDHLIPDHDVLVADPHHLIFVIAILKRPSFDSIKTFLVLGFLSNHD